MKIFMLLALISCASAPEPYVHTSSYNINVDSITGPVLSPKRFKLKAGKGIAVDLRYKELEGITAKALELDGFVQDNAAPEINIILSYYVGQPQIHTDVDSRPARTNSRIQNAWGQNIGTIRSAGIDIDSTTYTKYERKVVLKAFSVKANEEVWETTITSLGSSNDLREVFPYLVFAGTKFYGKSHKDSFSIDDKDARVEALRAPASN